MQSLRVSSRVRIFVVVCATLLSSLSLTEKANAVACSPTTSTSGVFTVVKFTTVTTCDWTVPTGVTSIITLIVAGGGGGGFDVAGGGGAGGLLYYGTETPKTPNGAAISVTPGNIHTIVVGAGGTGATSLSTPFSSQTTGRGVNGGDSYLRLASGTQYTAIGGGGGNSRNNTNTAQLGGSGGGGGYGNNATPRPSGGAGTGSGVTLQGYAGGKIVNGSANGGAGGGGAGAIGTDWTDGGADTSGKGGDGLAYSITGTSNYYGGGGGGGAWNAKGGIGGSGGGGAGGSKDSVTCRTNCTTNVTARTGNAGTANTGGGGGGSGWAGSNDPAGAGGSGIIIVAYTTPTPPTYSSISVSAGSTLGGTSTVITGTNLTGTTSITVGGVAATLETITATTVAITTPAGTAGARNIVITNPSGSVTATSAYTYFAPPVLNGTTQSLLATSGKVAYDTVTATSSNTPISFTLTGNGPAGITIDTQTANTAVLTVGISTASGVYIETVTARDASSISSTFVITVTVAQAISLTATNEAISKAYGVAATETITATLGTGNKTLTLTNLTGETNISIDTSTTNVAILRVGAGATTGTYSVSINAVDSLSATASLAITISVSTAAAITITVATPNAFTYTPSGISLTNSYTASGLVAGDTVTAITYQYGVDTATTSASIPTNAGTYYIVPSAVTLTDSHQGNYAGIIYVSSVLTINRAEDSGFMSYSTAEAVVGNSYTLYVAGGNGTGSVAYLVTGGTATGCSITLSVLIATSAGTCIVAFTREQSTNYNAKSSSVTITFRTYEVLTTASTPSTSSSHGIVLTGGGTPWSKNATASPSISSFTPSSGPVGTTITITGTGLNGVTVIRLNFEDMASVTGVSPTSVTAVVQSGATSGPIYIENSYGADFNFDGFTVTTP